MNTIKINLYAIFLYIFLVAIFYVAGMAFGGVLLFLFFLVLLFPLFSCILMVYTSLSFRFYQEFSNDHPVKGDTVVYKLCIENEAILPNPCVAARFKKLGNADIMVIEPLSLYLKRKQSFVKEYDIHCPYRGVYTVGLESLVVADMLDWISFEPKVWFKTFYVYPRVIALFSLFLDKHSHSISGGSSGGSLADNLLMKGLVQYRAGMPVSHIYWKKFMSGGEPVLREYEATSWPGLDIYLDLSREGDATESMLEREDCSVEIAIAIAKYLLDRSIPTGLHASGEERYDFYGAEKSSFHALHKATIGFFFKKGVSVVKTYRNDTILHARGRGTVIFVTHFPDPEIFDLVSDLRNRDTAIYVVLNQTGMNDDEKRKSDRYAKSLTEKGGYVRIVNGPATIREDLEEKL